MAIRPNGEEHERSPSLNLNLVSDAPWSRSTFVSATHSFSHTHAHALSSSRGGEGP